MRHEELTLFSVFCMGISGALVRVFKMWSVSCRTRHSGTCRKQWCPAIEKSQNNKRAELELHGLHGCMIQE